MPYLVFLIAGPKNVSVTSCGSHARMKKGEVARRSQRVNGLTPAVPRLAQYRKIPFMIYSYHSIDVVEWDLFKCVSKTVVSPAGNSGYT